MKLIALLIASATAFKLGHRVRVHGDKEYPHWMNGFGGYHTYIRDVPDRFEDDADDILMRSLYENYATEGRTGDKPNGMFWLDEKNAKAVSEEVIETHLTHDKGKAKSFVAANFAEMWERYDVNGEGKVELDRMPMFLR